MSGRRGEREERKVTFDGTYVEIGSGEYDEEIAARLIDFVFSNTIRDETAPNATHGMLLINFSRVSLLYDPDGYSNVDGSYEAVIVNGHECIAAMGSENFLNSETLKPLRFRKHAPVPAARRHALTKRAIPKVSVIIPIYGSLRNTYDVVKEVENFAAELRSLGGKVLVSVDGHATKLQTQQHAEILGALPADLVQVFSQNENIGFIGNVNFLYEKTRPDDIVVLLTSDVKLQPNSISRVVTPLLEDDRIALSTPFAVGGENLEAPESTLLHWRQLDDVLSNIDATYPDAETNVGYMLAVDRRKYQGQTLFDTFFNNGYGDDSDLYYRCVNLGFRGVLVDNCCVLHEHGASFSHTEKRSLFQVENRRRFMERWGDVYAARQGKASDILHQRRNVLGAIASALSASATTPEIVFLLPTNDRRIGGVCAVFDIAESLCDSGIQTAVLCKNSPYDESMSALKSISLNDSLLCGAALESAAWLIATSHDTCGETKRLARQHACKAGYFIQGPEFSFSEGEYLSSVLTGYAGFDALFSVSEYLKEIVRQHVGDPIHLIPYGPPSLKYFETGAERENRSIAIQLNGNPNKGSSFVAGVIAALIRDGYHFYSFGNEALRGKRQNFCTHLGFLSAAEKIRLFNNVEFYLDASNFEGLGLLLLESIQCGAIPIYRHNGGSADILKSAGAGIEIGDYAAIKDIRSKLSDFRNGSDWAAERRRCKEAVKSHSLELATSAMENWRNASY